MSDPAGYQLTRLPEVVLRLADQAFVTTDPESPDWQAYEAWLAAGHTPQPADPVVLKAAAPLTPEQRLARAGLTPKELHALLAPLIHEQIDLAVRKGGGQGRP